MRRGSVLVLVVFVAMVVSTALFALNFMTKTDASTTAKLLREMTATTMAESIAAQIEARVNTHPWGERFWLDATPGANPPQVRVGRDSPFLDLSRDALPLSDFEVAGIVKDLPGELREYRVYLEVGYRGETFAFSWDKRWDKTLLMGLGQGTLDVSLDGPDAAQGASDALIETIKTQVETAGAPDATPAQRDALKDLRRDEPSFKATAITPGPAKQPALPALPGDGGV
jgi:hypothetical protein